MTEDEKLILASIERTRLDTNRALVNKDLNSYLSVFSDVLKYTQLDGKTISKSQLSKDTKVYFSRIHSVDHNFRRENFSFENDIFTEHGTQDTSVYIRAFIVFLVKWTVNRKGIYSWQRENDKWKIISMKILEEKTRLGRGLWLFSKKRTGNAKDNYEAGSL